MTDQMLQALMGTQPNATAKNKEDLAMMEERRKNTYNEENRPDLIKSLLGVGMMFVPGMQGAGLGTIASGLTNKKAVNPYTGDSIQGQQDNSYSQLGGMAQNAFSQNGDSPQKKKWWDIETPSTVA